MFESDSSQKHALEFLRLEAECRQLAFETDRPDLASQFARTARVWADLAESGSDTGAKHLLDAAANISGSHLHNCEGMNPDKKSVVLVVESEAVIQIETALTIEDAGYVVLATSDADEAIAALEAREDICAVFTEIRIDGHLNGLDLGRAIAERWPLVRLIMTSSGRRRDNFPADWHYIQKPYFGWQIIDALRTLVPLSPGFVG